MVFNLFLYAFNICLKTGFGAASLLDKSFKSQLKERDFTILIKTMKTHDTRYYALTNGKFSSKKKDNINVDFLIEWSDRRTAVSTLFTRSPKALVKGLTNALASGNLKVEFNIQGAMWFGSMVKKMGEILTNLSPVKRIRK